MFINRLIQNLQPYQKDIYGSIEPFCDNKEQGLMLSLFNQITDDQFYIWACESKTDKDLMIITSNEKTNQNLYMADDLETGTYINSSGNAGFYIKNKDGITLDSDGNITKRITKKDGTYIDSDGNIGKSKKK